MRVLRNIYNGIGWVSDRTGSLLIWLVLALVIIIDYDVIMRYLFNAPTIWSFDVTRFVLATICAVGFAYVWYHRSNIRIDLLYARYSTKGKLIFDIILTIIFFFPMLSLLTWVFIRDAIISFQTQEIEIYGVWDPLSWPYKAAVAFGISLLFLQGIATFIKDVASLIKGGKEPW